MRFKIYILLIISLLASSCGEYEKLLKSTDYELKKTKAIEYYEQERFIKASELLTMVIPRYRATDEAENLVWISANCYYGLRDYMTASAAYRNFADTYPYSENAEEATFKAAYCDYLQSPRPELDQALTVTAIEGFTYFQRRFPASEKIEESKKLIKELQDNLVEKSYLSARLYYDLKQYRAAIVALSNSLKEYPETKFREELLFLKLESSYLYAVNSVAARQQERYQDTLDEYYSFIEEFPQSRFIKDTERIYKSTAGVLKIEVSN